MRHYDLFILRVWRSTDMSDPAWAARLEHQSGTETLRFADVNALLGYLGQRIAADSRLPCHAITEITMSSETPNRIIVEPPDIPERG